MNFFWKRKKKIKENQPVVNKEKIEVEEIETIGWDAITNRFQEIYPEQVNPWHYGTLIKAIFGGNDPLDGISIYDGGEYWHFVTYGFSEIYGKENKNKEVSGFGFELTYKLKKLPSMENNESEIEIRNVCGILQSLGRYVFQNGRGFEANQYIYTKQVEGIDANQQSKLTGFATVLDDAGMIATENGQVQFICVVGLTNAELVSIYESEHPSNRVEEITDLLGTDITDYSRESLI